MTSLRRHVIWDAPDDGGDSTYLVHTSEDGELPESMPLPDRDEGGTWHPDPRFAHVMGAEEALQALDDVDSERVFRHRFHVVPVVVGGRRSKLGFPYHDTSCTGTCGGIFRCTKCRRMVGWCVGAADHRPNWCADCTAAEMWATDGTADRKAIRRTDRPAKKRTKTRKR